MDIIHTTIHTLLQSAKAKGLSRLDAELLLAEVLSESRVTLYRWPEKRVSEKDAKQFNTLVMRRLAGEPLAYILGKKEFWSLTLDVNPDVLIPRPETELLVEVTLKLLEDERSEDKRPKNILELGTGSGAIALALALERPNWNLFASDISKAAIAIAQENARKLSVNNICFLQGDWFAALDGFKDSAKAREANLALSEEGKPLFDAIISNPPYIAEDDSHLSSKELRFEPLQALRSFEGGLLDLKKIISTAEHYLLSKAWLLLEHGYDQDSKIEALLKDKHYIHIEHYKDLAGVNRVTVGQKA